MFTKSKLWTPGHVCFGGYKVMCRLWVGFPKKTQYPGITFYETQINPSVLEKLILVTSVHLSVNFCVLPIWNSLNKWSGKYFIMIPTNNVRLVMTFIT